MTRLLKLLTSLSVSAIIASSAWANDWTLVPNESKLTFTGTQAGATFEGTFSNFAARIHFAADALEDSNILITIDMASASTGSADRDTTLPGADWFDTANHPTATFASTQVTATETGYAAQGTLTLKGTTRDVVLPFTLALADDKAHAQGALSIDRNDFGVGAGPLSPMAGNDVAIQFDIIATR